MTRRISIRRIACFVIAVGLLATAIYCGLYAWRLDREFQAWITARPVVMAVDLSKTGQFTAPFHQTCCVSHGEAFYVTVPTSMLAGLEPATLLEGLHGTIKIADRDGNEIESLDVTNQPPRDVSRGQPIMLAYFRPFADGNYTVTIDVDSGAPALAGAEQVIHAEYQLCGVERYPSMIAAFVAFVLGVPALIMLPIAAVAFCRYGFRMPKDAS